MVGAVELDGKRQLLKLCEVGQRRRLIATRNALRRGYSVDATPAEAQTTNAPGSIVYSQCHISCTRIRQQRAFTVKRGVTPRTLSVGRAMPAGATNAVDRTWSGGCTPFPPAHKTCGYVDPSSEAGASRACTGRDSPGPRSTADPAHCHPRNSAGTVKAEQTGGAIGLERRPYCKSLRERVPWVGAHSDSSKLLSNTARQFTEYPIINTDIRVYLCVYYCLISRASRSKCVLLAQSSQPVG